MGLKQEMSLKRIFGFISILEILLRPIYVTLVTQGRIIDTVTMQNSPIVLLL